MSAFSVGQALRARWSSYLCRSCRARPADDGLHLLLAYRTGATCHKLHKQALHHILFPHATRYWYWSIVVVGAESFVSTAAEFRARICAVPSSLSRTGGNRLFNLVLLICVRYKGRNIQNTLLELRRNLLQAKSRIFNLVNMATVHVQGVGRLCRGEKNDNSHPQPSGPSSNDGLNRTC
jgi:hypothetical protein